MAIKILYTEDTGLYQQKDFDGGMFLSGSLHIESVSYKNITVTSNYTAGNESVIFANCLADDITITLPPALSSRGDIFHIKKIDPTGNFLIVVGHGGDTIDGSANKQINTQYTTITVTSNGSEWFVL